MNITTQITMTSLELVKFINASREDGDSELRHSDFLSKVPKVLMGDERKFSFVYMGQNGQERPSSSQHGAVRTFKGVTKLGLKYGKNLTNAKSQSETQPHWYREKFTEFLGVLGL